MIKAKIKLTDQYLEKRKQIETNREKLITESLPLKPLQIAKIKLKSPVESKNHDLSMSKNTLSKIKIKLKNQSSEKIEQIINVKSEDHKNFSISFNNIWKELQFKHKSYVKSILKKNFEENIDYTIAEFDLNLTQNCYEKLLKMTNKKKKKTPKKTPISDNPDLKWCIMCLQFIPRIDFSIDRQKKDGLDARCKKCKIIRTKKQKTVYRSQPEDEKIKKYPLVKCRLCEKILDRSQFNKLAQNASGVMYECKICWAELQKKHDDEIFLIKLDWKRKTGKCQKCGTTDLRVLEFDHINPIEKKNNIAGIRTKIKLLEELEKTALLCVNCHRLRSNAQRLESKQPDDELSQTMTAKKSRKQIQKNFTYINSVKNQIGSCADCQFKVNTENFCVFDFHHLDPTNKIAGISHMAGGIRCSIKTIQEEIDKTILLCANCHCLRTGIELNYRGFNSNL